MIEFSPEFNHSRLKERDVENIRIYNLIPKDVKQLLPPEHRPTWAIPKRIRNVAINKNLVPQTVIDAWIAQDQAKLRQDGVLPPPPQSLAEEEPQNQTQKQNQTQNQKQPQAQKHIQPTLPSAVCNRARLTQPMDTATATMTQAVVSADCRDIITSGAAQAAKTLVELTGWQEHPETRLKAAKAIIATYLEIAGSATFSSSGGTTGGLPSSVMQLVDKLRGERLTTTGNGGGNGNGAQQIQRVAEEAEEGTSQGGDSRISQTTHGGGGEFRMGTVAKGWSALTSGS